MKGMKARVYMTFRDNADSVVVKFGSSAECYTFIRTEKAVFVEIFFIFYLLYI
jgi:hypothetical protein